MKIIPTPIEGAYLIEIEPITDDRGFFARMFCKQIFAQHGLVTEFLQMSVSHNNKIGQIRGMHYQEEPYAETKIVKCTRGAIQDVILDLRKHSTTYKQWFSATLSEENYRMLYIPKGCAHGYRTLTTNSELFYMMDQIYVKEAAREVSYKEYEFFK